MKILFMSSLGVMVGAKFFGCLSGLYRTIGMRERITYSSIAQTGIVYYGGLLGFILVYYLCLRFFYQCLDNSMMDLMAVVIPLFHSITRMGCFFAGCCYGKKYSGLLGIRYKIINHGELDVSSRLPVQIMEAFFELVVFLYLLNLIKKRNWKDEHILIRYLLIYSFGRFFLEFLRGDAVRGVIYGVSFSQLISVGIWLWLFYKYVKANRKLGGK